MAVGRTSTLLKSLRAEVSSAVPAWAKSMFLGQPSARTLRFSESADRIDKRSGVFQVPQALLHGSITDLAPTKRANVDVYLPQSEVLHRQLKVPKSSLHKVEKIVALDTLQKTPFQMPDIHSVVSVTKGEGTMLAVDQWIARRDRIAGLKERLSASGLRTRKLYVDGVQTEALADFSAELAPRARFWQLINLGLVLILLLSLTSWFVRPAWTTAQGLETQKAETAKLSKEAVELRASVERLRGSASERSAFVSRVTKRQTALATLRELTVLLPDNVWVSDLQIQRDRIILRGTTAGSAADLLLSVTKSRRFETPRLTGPVSQTPEGFERFDMSFGVKGAQQ